MNDHADHCAITDVLVRYASGIDRRDWELFRTAFTPDCVLDYGQIGTWNGIDEVVAFMRMSHEGAGHTLHRLSNFAVDVDGDGANATTYVDALVMAPDGASGVNAIGFYEDVLVRGDEGWRISRRRFTTVRIAATNAS
ncbi:MAG: nuclear transport factor 2 family protein [Gordonia amarae]